MDPIRATDDLTRAVSSWFKTAVHRAAFPPARRLASRENPLRLGARRADPVFASLDTGA
jgi:hypothetical protein